MPGTSNNRFTKTNKMFWSFVPTETTDWKLEVDILPSRFDSDQTCRNEPKRQKRTKTYYVHKTILADTSGLQGSRYFGSLFCSDIEGQVQFKEFQLGASIISFPESVAAAMPVFLDYLYDTAGIASTAASSSTTTAARSAAMLSLTGYLDEDIESDGKEMNNDNNSWNNAKWSGHDQRRIFAKKEAAEHPYGSDEDEDMEEETVVDEDINKVSSVVRNSPELYCLGEYFCVPSLKNYVLDKLSTSGIMESIDDAFAIYTKAESLGPECKDVVSIILKFIVSNLSTIEPADEIVQYASLNFWLKVAKVVASDCYDGRDTDWEAVSSHWSKLVVQVIENNSDSMTPSAFQELTSIESLPIVSRCAVSQLMKLDEKFRLKDPSPTTHNHDDELSLHSRCAKAISECHFIRSLEQASLLLTNHTPDFIGKVLFYQSRNVADYKTDLDCAVKVVSGFQPVPRGARILTQTPRIRVSPSEEIARYHDTLTENMACQRFLNNEKHSSVYFYTGP